MFQLHWSREYKELYENHYENNRLYLGKLAILMMYEPELIQSNWNLFFLIKIDNFI